jgi:uncharacterized protein (DUF1501 family)
MQRSRTGKNLGVIQLSGVNDGLNTIIPYGNDIYYRARPKLAISKKEVVRLDDQSGLNPVMKPLRALFEDGGMSIVNSVGYPNPSRSHFRSMDIWQTASGSHQSLGTGWIGRYLDSQCQGCDSYHALELNERLSLPLKGHKKSGFVMQNPTQLKQAANNDFLKELGQAYKGHEHPQVQYLYKTMIDTQSSTDYLYQQSRKHRSRVTYPNTPFAKDLKQIAELMTADTDIRIYYISLGNFDTHSGQRSKQDRLLRTYAQGVSAFAKDLKKNGLFDDTLIMTFSEFGRRVGQNASYGTDHGTANHLFLMGGRLRHPGFVNNLPDLSDLDDGDLKYQVDFRQIYAEILGKWMDADAAAVLGQEFEMLGLV